MSQEFNRYANKVAINKIILTDNSLSDELANKFIEESFETNPYTEHIDSEKDYKYWKGFTKDYVYSYKKKTVTTDNGNEELKYEDKGLDELTKDDILFSKIYKNTYVIRNNATSKPRFVDTVILPDINLICIIGSKEYCDEPKNVLYSFLNEKNVKYEDINISHDFLLWVLWKLSDGKSISEDITLNSFENLRVGIPNSNDFNFDNMPTNIKTEGSNQELPSLPICYGLFNNRSINEFRGEFLYNKKKFILNIDIVKNMKSNETIEESRIHILSSGCLEDLYYSQKLELSLLFIYELSNIIKEWNQYDNKEKYPNIEFLDKLSKKAENDFKDTMEYFEEYKKRYSEKIKK